MRIALLAGGTGGAKLAAGLSSLRDVQLAVIANTGDDVEVHGLHVSPDPDLITYWLAGEIDEQRGWGIRDDSFAVGERLERFGAPGWFELGDRDLAACVYRTHFVAEGGTRTAAQAQITAGLGVEARVLPMSEQPVRTRVLTRSGWRGLQEFLILDAGRAEIESIEVDGLGEARPTREVLAAIDRAEAIVIGPSNPVLSIGPILALPELRAAIERSAAPLIAVSPLIAGRSVKGPTEECLRAVGRPVSAAGVASLYEPLLEAMIVDAADPEPPPSGLRAVARETLMEGAAGRAALARAVVDLAEAMAAERQTR